MSQKCSYKGCDREVYAGKYQCIFHAEKETEQEVRDFRIALARLLKQYRQRKWGEWEWWNLRGFIFPDNWKYIGRPIHFARWHYAQNVDFSEATFKGNTSFDGARFRGDAWFEYTTFKGNTDFSGALFEHVAGFGDATFRGAALFKGASFNNKALFQVSTFDNMVDFENADFAGETTFNGVTFRSGAAFFIATFSGNIDFAKATFTGEAGFDEAEFSGFTRFEETTFLRAAYFNRAIFQAETRFNGAIFERQIDLDFSDFIGKPEFPMDLRGIDLRSATLNGAELSHVDLRGANIEGIDLTNARIHRVKIFAQNLAKAKIRPEQLSGFDVEEIPEEAEVRELIRHPKGRLRIELKAEEPSVIALMQLFLNYERTYDLLYALFFGQYTDADEYFHLILSPYSLVPERFRLRVSNIKYGSLEISFLADANIIEVLATSGAAIALWKWITPKGLKDAVEAWKFLKESKKLDKEAKKLELEIKEKELDIGEKTEVLSDRQMPTLPIPRTSEEMDSVRELIASQDFKADPRVFELVDELLSKLPKEQASQKNREKIAKFTQLFLEKLAKSNGNLPEALKIISVKAEDTGEEL